jgi:predicted DNA-binding transcriptional regulator AlpA
MKVDNMKEIALITIPEISRKYNIARYHLWNWYRRDNKFPRSKGRVGNLRMPLFDEGEVVSYLKTKGVILSNGTK